MAGSGSCGCAAVAADFCSLSAEELAERRALIQREIAPFVRACVDLPGDVAGVAWELVRSDAARRKLDELAALERACCGERLEFAVRDGGPGGGLRLEVLGPDAGAFRSLVPGASASPDAPQATPSRTRRLAKAGGIGLVASLVACCVLPFVVAAAVGATAAAPLLVLDDPRVFVPAAVAISALVFLVDRRRKVARSEAAESACGCGDDYSV